MATTTETRTEALGTRPQRPQINRSPKGPSNFTSVVYGYDEVNIKKSQKVVSASKIAFT